MASFVVHRFRRLRILGSADPRIRPRRAAGAAAAGYRRRRGLEGPLDPRESRPRASTGHSSLSLALSEESVGAGTPGSRARRRSARLQVRILGRRWRRRICGSADRDPPLGPALLKVRPSGKQFPKWTPRTKKKKIFPAAALSGSGIGGFLGPSSVQLARGRRRHGRRRRRRRRLAAGGELDADSKFDMYLSSSSSGNTVQASSVDSHRAEHFLKGRALLLAKQGFNRCASDVDGCVELAQLADNPSRSADV